MKTLTSSPIMTRLTQAMTEFPELQSAIKQLLAGQPANYNELNSPLTKMQWCQLIDYVTEGGSPIDFFVYFDHTQPRGYSILKYLYRAYRNDLCDFAKTHDLSPYMELHDYVIPSTVLGYLIIKALETLPFNECHKLYLKVDELAGHVLLDRLPQSERLKLCRSIPVEDAKRQRYAASYFVYYGDKQSVKDWDKIMDAFPLPDPLTAVLLETGYRLAVATEY